MCLDADFQAVLKSFYEFTSRLFMSTGDNAVGSPEMEGIFKKIVFHILPRNSTFMTSLSNRCFEATICFFNLEAHNDIRIVSSDAAY